MIKQRDIELKACVSRVSGFFIHLDIWKYFQQTKSDFINVNNLHIIQYNK